MIDPKPYVQPEVMLDIETLGKRPGCVILSVATVQFTGEPVCWLAGSENYYAEISLKSCTKAGLTIDPETLQWWMQQDSKPPVQGIAELEIVLRNLRDRIDGKTLVWANSPNFDCTILEAAYDYFRMPPPWSHRNLRCLRTALDILPYVGSEEVPVVAGDVAHNALSDAQWQVRRLLMARERAKRTDYI